ncbi:hypothetical protein EV182_000442, partial [Spiromyces aspiralis]
LIDRKSVYAALNIPASYTGVQYDMMTDLVEVRHRIKFMIRIRDINGTTHSIYIAVPVSISPVPARDDYNLLPRYEAAILGNDAQVIQPDGCQQQQQHQHQQQPPPPSYETVVEEDDILQSMHPLAWFRNTTVPASVDHTPVHSPHPDHDDGAGGYFGPQAPAPDTVVATDLPEPPSYTQLTSHTTPSTPHEGPSLSSHLLGTDALPGPQPLPPDGTTAWRQASVTHFALPPVAGPSAAQQQRPRASTVTPSSETGRSSASSDNNSGGGTHHEAQAAPNNKRSSIYSTLRSLQTFQPQHSESRRSQAGSPAHSPHHGPRSHHHHGFLQATISRLLHPHLHHSHGPSSRSKEPLSNRQSRTSSPMISPTMGAHDNSATLRGGSSGGGGDGGDHDPAIPTSTITAVTDGDSTVTQIPRVGTAVTTALQQPQQDPHRPPALESTTESSRPSSSGGNSIQDKPPTIRPNNATPPTSITTDNRLLSTM